jgi:hypothetical protein
MGYFFSEAKTMSENQFPYSVMFSEIAKREYERTAALLNLDDWIAAIGPSRRLGLQRAEQCVKGFTEVLFCTPQLKSLLEDNPKFFEAPSQEGVIEWLTPFVLGKSIIPPEENQ